MADAFGIGFDQPGLAGVISDNGAAPQPSPLAPDRTDADWSNVPEARTTSKGPDGDTPGQHPFADFWSRHTGPQEAPKPETDITSPVTGVPSQPPADPSATAPDASGAPDDATAQTGNQALDQMFAWRHTADGQHFHEQTESIADLVGKSAKSAWEDAIFGSFQNAQADAIAAIISGAKEKLGVTLEDPTRNGYRDEAIHRLVTEAQWQSSGNYFDPNNPEGFFGGGVSWRSAVRKTQMQIFDEKRQALADKINGDTAYDRAGENSDALSVLKAEVPGDKLGIQLSREANAEAAEAAPRVENWLVRGGAELVGGFFGGLRNPLNDAALMVGGGIEPYLAKTYFPLAPKALGIISDMTEGGAQQALINMGLTGFEEPWRQAANEARGEDHGLRPALNDIGMAALTGGVPGAFIHGVKALGALHGPNAQPWIDEFVREVRTQSAKANIDAFLKEAGATPGGPEPEPEFAPDLDHDAREEILKKSRTFMDAVHTFERMKGLPEGSTYANVGRNRPGAPPPPPPSGAGAAAEPGNRGAGAAVEPAGAGTPLLEGPRRMLPAPERGAEPPAAPPEDGPPRLPGPTFPQSPELSDRARNRPSPSTITPAAIERAEADYGALPPRMPGVPPSEHLRVFIEALRHGEAPDVFPPPEPAMSAPPAADSNFLPPDHLPALATAPGGERAGEQGLNLVPHLPAGEVFEHRGRPVTKGIEFPARELRTDAATYQYKAGGDANGVTDRLQTVRRWNPLSVGNVVVHERLDGARYIVDGHQRRGLANRIMDANPTHPPISLPGFLYKEADGWTPEDARAEAAAKNIREGLGDSIDIARILRDKPELWDDSLPIGRGDMKEARGLANLSDEAWGMVINGKPRRDFASFVGNMAEDRSTHLAIMDDLVKFEPRTQNEARMIIADAMQAGFNTRETMDLFGPSEVTESLRGERARVYAAAERLLRDDKRIFSMLDEEAPRIIEAGNILADTNAERADRASQLAQGLITLARRQGPISAALNRAAQRVASGENPKTAARAFLNELPALLTQEGLRVADVTAAPKYDLDKPQGREEQVRDLEAEFMATQPTMFAEPPKSIDEQRTAIHADMKQKLLDADMPAEQAEANAALFASRYVTRALRKGRADPEQMYREANIQPRGDAQREAQIAGETAAGRTLNQTATVPTFYSAVERAVTNAKQAKASPDQWLAMLKNMPGVKPEEMKWLGLEDWLREQKGAVTREAIADYVRANAIQIHEVMHADEEGEAAGLEADVARRWVADAFGDRERAEQNYLRAVNDRGLTIDPETIAAIRQPPLSPTRYGSYKLSGGDNYRELLLTLPTEVKRPADEARQRLNEMLINKYGSLESAFSDWTPEESEEFYRVHEAALEESAGTSPDKYTSSHWDEPNILAHVRFDDRIVDGKRALHIAEVQSDWHQEGRKHGYKDGIEPIFPGNYQQWLEKRGIEYTPDREEEFYNRTGPDMEAWSDEMSAYNNAIMHRGKKVPDAPFKTTWNEFAIKRMIRHAAENGYDLLTWDTGATSAERYDLSKQISRVRWVTRPEYEFGSIEAHDHDNEPVISRQARHEELPDIIGKELADRLASSEPTETRGAQIRELSGLDLKVGGEGMHGFYDKILPATVAKLTKKFGGKVTMGDTGVPQGFGLYAGPEPTPEQFEEVSALARSTGNTRISPITGKEVMFPIERVSNSWALSDVAHAMERGASFTEAMSKHGNRDLAEIFGGEHGDLYVDRATPVHTLAITPELRDAAVNEGFPLFQAGDGELRGQITLRDNGAVIDLFKKRDASTIPHEAGHLWLKEMAEDAADPDAPQQMKDDFKTVLDWLGAKDAASITDAQHEKFADGYVQWLRDGSPPSARLARAFAAFRDWLRQIYRTVRSLGKKIPDEVRAVFERLHATDEEIEAQRAATEATRPSPAVSPPSPFESTKSPVESATSPLESPAAAPPLEDVQGAWAKATDAIRPAAVEAWTKAEAAGARKQAKAKFQSAFDAALTGGERPTAKWETAGYEAGKAWAKTKAGKAAAKLVRAAQQAEAAHVVTPPPAAPEIPPAAAAVIQEAGEALDDAIGAAKASPEPLDNEIGALLEQEIKPLLEEPPAPEPTPAPAAPPPQFALNHAEDLAGRVAYHNGDVALIQGFSSLTGKPVYVGAKGDMRARYDIESDKTNLFTPAERAELVEAKRAAVAVDEEAHAANPDGPFAGGKRFAASPSVPKELADFAEGLLGMVDVKDRVYLTTVEDARAGAADFHGPFGAIGSAGVDTGTFGTTRRLPNGDHYIAISLRPSEQLNLETVSHEVGHIVEKTSWANASPEVKAAVDKEYEAWRDAQRKPGVTARELIRSTRTPETAEAVKLSDENLAASEMNRRDSYWTARDEWFADQVARWATSAAKPMTLVERFFASIAAALRRIHAALGEKFKPVKSMKDWLDSLGPADIVREEKAAEAGPEGTLQTLMPGVQPVTDMDRIRLAAGAPLRGGNREMPAGGLFDDVARAQNDLFDSTPTDDGLKTSAQLATQVPIETALSKFVSECQP